MNTPGTAFELLQAEILKEAGMESKSRSIEYRLTTLEYFLKCNKRTEDHDLWRECIMHQEMLAILDRRFNAINPHKKGEAEYEAALAGSFNDMPDKLSQILYRYTQEIDEDGQTQEEIDKITITKFPDISRLELEVQAAENYIATKWGIERKQPPEKEAEESKIKKPFTNPNPVLNWKGLLKELENPNVSADTIRQAIKRSIIDRHKNGCPPWEIGGCVSEYQIVDYQVKDNIGHPTPATCQYQKIAIDKSKLASRKSLSF